LLFILFFFSNTSTTEIYTLSLHDALPIYIIKRDNSFLDSDTQLIGLDEGSGASSEAVPKVRSPFRGRHHMNFYHYIALGLFVVRSEEHTSELQSQSNLVCRLLLEKKKQKQ